MLTNVQKIKLARMIEEVHTSLIEDLQLTSVEAAEAALAFIHDRVNRIPAQTIVAPGVSS